MKSHFQRCRLLVVMAIVGERNLGSAYSPILEIESKISTSWSNQLKHRQ